MSTYTKSEEVYQYTETVIYRDGVEIARIHNHNDSWYDTESTEEISEEEAEDYQ